MYLSHQPVNNHAVGSKEKLRAYLALVQYINVCSFSVAPYSILDQARLAFFVFSCDGNALIEKHLKHFQWIYGINTFSQTTVIPVLILQG